jgi:hypothetical protein
MRASHRDAAYYHAAGDLATISTQVEEGG